MQKLHDPPRIIQAARGGPVLSDAPTIDRAMVPDEAAAATVLIAEDHLDSRDALQALLEAFDYHVVVAANGREAVERALVCRPDLILMDIMMPELDGFEATRRIRGHLATRGIPIIAVTAMEGAHDLALQAGANDFVRKPVETRLLLHKMRALLDRTD